MVNSPLLKPNLLVVLVISIAVGGGIFVAARHDFHGDRGSGLPPSFQYDLTTARKSDSDQVRYRPSGEITVPLKEARAVAVGLQDNILVVGDQALVVFSFVGRKIQEIKLADQPRAVAVGGEEHPNPGRFYLAMKDRVEVYDPRGQKLATWENLGPKALLTSIAVGERDVVVADAGRRIVHRFDLAGQLVGSIGQRDPARDQRGFIVPSPYFDVALSTDGLVRVANPGRHRIEGWTLDGHLEVVWGKAGDALEAFCGCCNPANFAILPDQGFVTVEKGIPRVKVYTSQGDYRGLVVPIDTLAPNPTELEETREEFRHPVLDVAADSRGRILVLDPGVGKVRIYEHVADGSKVKK